MIVLPIIHLSIHSVPVSTCVHCGTKEKNIETSMMLLTQKDIYMLTKYLYY